MDYPLTRIMGAATSGYALYALAKPGHLADAMQTPSGQRPALDSLARTYGVRDLATSALLFGDSRMVRAAAAIRIAGDLGDAAILSAQAPTAQVRKKILGVTVSWAALNALAVWIDSRRA